jgi:hypothetical protein
LSQRGRKGGAGCEKAKKSENYQKKGGHFGVSLIKCFSCKYKNKMAQLWALYGGKTP